MTLVILMGGLLPAAMAADEPKSADLPLTHPQEIIRIAPAPPEFKPAISREKAIELAVRYSGFELENKAVEARLASYSDIETLGGEGPAFPDRVSAEAWVVSFPNASFNTKQEKPSEIKCPLHVAIHARSGQFLAAYGDSAKTWVKAKPAWQEWTFAEPKEPPILNVRYVLQKYSYRPSPTGQFFVRYATITTGGPTDGRTGKAEIPPIPVWIYSLRGVVLRGFSVPTGYTGPEPYATRCDYILTDKPFKDTDGHTHKAGEDILGRRY
jgi:hypothetical protein